MKGNFDDEITKFTEDEIEEMTGKLNKALGRIALYSKPIEECFKLELAQAEEWIYEVKSRLLEG